MSRLSIDFIGNDKRVFAKAYHAFIDSFEQVRQHHRVSRLDVTITLSLADPIHRAEDHADVVAGYCLNNVVKYADPGTNGHVTP